MFNAVSSPFLFSVTPPFRQNPLECGQSRRHHAGRRSYSISPFPCPCSHFRKHARTTAGAWLNGHSPAFRSNKISGPFYFFLQNTLWWGN